MQRNLQVSSQNAEQDKCVSLYIIRIYKHQQMENHGIGITLYLNCPSVISAM